MVIFELNHGATRHKFIEDFSFLTSRICLIQALKCPKMAINVYFHFFLPSFYVCPQQRLKIPGDRILDRRTIINPIQAGEGEGEGVTTPSCFWGNTRKIKILCKKHFLTFHISIGDTFWGENKISSPLGVTAGVTQILSRGEGVCDFIVIYEA